MTESIMLELIILMLELIVSLNHYDDDTEALSCPVSIFFFLGRFSDPLKVPTPTFLLTVPFP